MIIVNDAFYTLGNLLASIFKNLDVLRPADKKNYFFERNEVNVKVTYFHRFLLSREDRSMESNAVKRNNHNEK